MKQVSNRQPGEGDVILHCGHLGQKSYHFAASPEPMGFQRPDGTKGEASWLCVCNDCFVKHGKNVGAVPIRGDGTWQGDKPAVSSSENVTGNLPASALPLSDSISQWIIDVDGRRWILTSDSLVREFVDWTERQSNVDEMPTKTGTA